MHTFLKHSRLHGFTLIELLVAAAIVSTLSSIAYGSYEQARAIARDVERSATIHQIILALKLYKEAHGKFPCHGWSTSDDLDYLQPLMDEGLLTKRPDDPTPERFLSYITYTDTIGGACGKIAHIDVDYETTGGECPYGEFAPGGTHCHVFYPQGLPCPSPYHIIYPLSECEDLQDTTNDY
jgi:prepilin-type N-terminal cleavage/methylation domain-containing protein